MESKTKMKKRHNSSERINNLSELIFVGIKYYFHRTKIRRNELKFEGRII